MVNATRVQLEKAARQRIEAAGVLCPSTGLSRPAVAAYLAHVGLECLLKAWLLLKNKAADTYALQKRIPESEVEILFSAKGHNLGMLAKKVSLDRHLIAQDEEHVLESKGWKRLVGGQRPYDVRYGTVTVSSTHAREEVETAMTLLLSLSKVLSEN